MPMSGTPNNIVGIELTEGDIVVLRSAEELRNIGFNFLPDDFIHLCGTAQTVQSVTREMGRRIISLAGTKYRIVDAVVEYVVEKSENTIEINREEFLDLLCE